MRQIARRVIWAIALPIIAFLILSGFLVHERQERAADIEQRMALLDQAERAAPLIHALQEERGASTAHLVAPDDPGLRQLVEDARVQTDDAIQALEQVLSDAPEQAPWMTRLRQHLAGVREHRDAVDRLDSTASWNLHVYTRVVEHLIEQVDELAGAEDQEPLNGGLDAFLALIHLQEHAGKERAMGATLIARGTPSNFLQQDFLRHVFLQQEYQMRFDRLAASDYRHQLENLLDFDAEDQLMALRSQLMDSALPEQNPALARAWFELATQRINAMQRLSLRMKEEMVSGMREEAGALEQANQQVYAATAGLLGITVLLSVGIGRGLYRQVEARRQDAERIEYLATHDPLTGLPNRTAFLERLDQCLARARAQGHKVGLHLVDLQGFTEVNATWGDEVGDRILEALARRLEDALPPGVIIARPYGDDFAIIQPRIDSEDELPGVAEKARAMAERTLQIGPRRIKLRGRAGAACFPQHGKSTNGLMTAVTLALQEAKRKDGTCVYVRGMYDRFQDRQAMARDLEHALERDELLLNYQAKIDLASGDVAGAEVLLRWHHPDRGAVRPDHFIPEAEHSGAIVPIGRWVLETACAQGRRWLDEGRPLKLAVNLSAAQFSQADLVDQIKAALNRSGLPPHLLELEITETTVMMDMESSVQTLQALRDLGVSLAIDDFGTGYSSLTYLRRFPVTVLKLDRSFVDGMEHGGDPAAIAAAVVQLGQVLSLSVVAEGVETEAQAEALRRLGCDMAQGFLYSRPQPVEQFQASLPPPGP